MPGYFIIDLDVDDDSVLADYERAASEHVVAAGGRFLVRGGRVVPLAGGWRPKRLVIEVSPDQQAVKDYYDSDVNKELSRTRLAGTGGVPTRAIAAVGLDDVPAPGTLARASRADVDGSAYLMVDIATQDGSTPTAFERAAPPVWEDAGGRVLVQGGQSTALEGDWRPTRLLLVEFPDLRTAEQAFRSVSSDTGVAPSVRALAVQGLASAANTAAGTMPEEVGTDGAGGVLWN